MNWKIEWKCNPICWFAWNSALKWENVNLITSWFFTSDDKEFFKYIESINNHFWLNLDNYSNFLIVIKKDFTFTFYNIDITWLTIKCQFISDKNKWEAVYKSDIIWIDSVELDNYDILDTDSIIFCFKNNWKYWLYFNLSTLIPNENIKLNLGLLSKELWKCYNFLFYNKELSYINNNEVYDLMLKDWWYPFFAILNDYEGLYNFYKSWKINNDIFDSIINKFNNDKLEKLTNKWFKNKVFKEKEKILKAWINSFLLWNVEWYINCLKNLWTEIEWLLHIYYFWETWNYNSHSKIIEHLKNRIENLNKSNLLTIWFNEKFIDFLLNHIFWYFDIKSWKLDFSRHTSSHWVAKIEDYNKYNAFQYILIIDQLYYYFIQK
jgi:hypothetical protein